MANTQENPQILRNILVRLDVGFLVAVNVTGFFRLQQYVLNLHETLKTIGFSAAADVLAVGLFLQLLNDVKEKRE